MSNNQRKPEEKPPETLPTIEELEAEQAEQGLEVEPLVSFVVPFIVGGEGQGEGATHYFAPNTDLMTAYLSAARAQIDAKTLEALQNGAEEGVRVRIFVDFE